MGVSHLVVCRGDRADLLLDAATVLLGYSGSHANFNNHCSGHLNRHLFYASVCVSNVQGGAA